MALLELRGVRVAHAAGTPWEQPALDRIDLRIEAGDRVIIVGGNGSGKSTLMSVLSGLIVPTEGSCELDHIPVSEQPDRVALLLQNTRLQLTRPTVSEELEDMAADASLTPGVVAKLGLGPLLNRRIDELSGGQQRRVGLATAIIRRADLLLLDEPMAGLDAKSVAGLLSALEVVRHDAIVVVVTHDFETTEPLLHQGNVGRVIEITDGAITEREPT